jgi:hypothetical protein
MSTTLILPFPLLPSLAGSATEPVTSGVAAMATLPDRALLERVAGGDADAFTILTAATSGPSSASSGWPAAAALAEEWLQEAFSRVWFGAARTIMGEVRPDLQDRVNTARSELPGRGTAPRTCRWTRPG